jgi:hypothetical protein
MGKWIKAWLFVGVISCGGRSLDVGSNDAGGADRIVGASALNLVGTWSGSIDGFQFPSGSNAVTMTLIARPDDSVAGTLVFGNLPAPPPPTNPDVGYPPGVFSCTYGCTPHASYYEGFPYTAHSLAFDGTELDLGIETLQVWNAWCQMQKSYPIPAPTEGGAPLYGCLPPGSFNYDYINNACTLQNGVSNQPIDCAKGYLCSYESAYSFLGAPSVCNCSATSCTSAALYGTTPGTGQSDVTFALRPTGGRMQGTTSGTFGDRGVHLSRQE